MITFHSFQLKNLAHAALVLLFSIALGLPLGTINQTEASALSGSQFQAGDIIDDFVFTNTNTMSVSAIQNFLNAKVPTCDTNGTQLTTHSNGSGGYYTRAQWTSKYYYNRTDGKNASGQPIQFTCLRNYKENTTTNANNLWKPTATVSGAISAAQIIYNVSKANKINPQVILVTLQKEQGLVTDNWPWANQFTAAMGYGCPDSSGCNSTYAGFYKQVSSAAAQFRNYITNPSLFNHGVGNYYVAYSPTSSCGGRIINIRNLATAALYNYTPYQPNSAALNNLTGTGDSCSAYGNRNFWYYFSSWFGSTHTSHSAYQWNLIGQNAYIDSGYTTKFTNDINIAPGQKAYLTVTALNYGYEPWTQPQVRLGTSFPRDRVSPLADDSWTAPNRIQMSQTTVLPGDTATFSFPIEAPATPGTYKEYFSLVAEGVRWLNDPGMYFTINVVSPVALTGPSSTTLASGQTLNAGEKLLSPDAQTVLTLQRDGNIVEYSDLHASWASATFDSTASRLTMQTDGNLVSYNKAGRALWSSQTNNNPGAYLSLQIDGNIVVYSASDTPLWWTGTTSLPDHLSRVDTYLRRGAVMYPGQKLETATRNYRLSFQQDGNLVLYYGNHALWASGTNNRGAHHAIMQYDGNFVIYNSQNKPLWSLRKTYPSVYELLLQGDGNLVLYNTAGKPLWSSGTNNKT